MTYQLAPLIALVRVERIWDADGAGDVDEGIDGGGKGNGLAAQLGAARLAQDDEAQRSDGQVVEEVVDDHQRTLRPRKARIGGIRGRDVEQSDEQHNQGADDKPPVVDGPAPGQGHEWPRQERADEAKSEKADAEIEGRRRGQACELEEVHGVTDDEKVANQRLDGVDHGGDEGATQVCTPEALGEADIRVGLVDLELRGQLDICQDGFAVDRGGGKPLQGAFSFGSLASSDEPPGALWAEWQGDEDDNGKDPLAGEWNVVAPPILAGLCAREDARGDELSNDEAQVDKGRADTSQLDGRDFADVGRGDDGIGAENDAIDQFGNEDLRPVLSGELDGDGDAADDAADGKRPAASEALEGVADGEAADDLPDGDAEVEGALPGCGDEVASVVGLAKVLLKLRNGDFWTWGQCGERGAVEA